MYFKEEAELTLIYARELDASIARCEEQLAEMKKSRPPLHQHPQEADTARKLQNLKAARARISDDIRDFIRRRDRHLQMILEDAELKAMMESTGVSFGEPS